MTRSSPRSGPSKSLDLTSISPAPIEGAQSSPRSPSPHAQQSTGKAGLTTLVRNIATDSPRDDVALTRPAELPSTPVPGPSKSVSLALSVARPPRLRIPGALLSPSLETPAPKLPPHIPQTPQTEPRVEALHNPYYRSMAPPPSPNLPPMLTPHPQPPESGGSVKAQPSSIASTAASTSTLSAPREVVDAAIAVAEKKLAGRVVKRVFSRKGARQHIFQSAVGLSSHLPGTSSLCIPA